MTERRRGVSFRFSVEGGEEVKRAFEDIGKVGNESLSKVAGASEQAGEAVERMSQRQQRALQSLIGRLDPAVKAERELARGVELLDAALKSGNVTVDEHARYVGQLKQRFTDAAQVAKAAANGVSGIGQAAAVSAGQMGMARRIVMQNLVDIGNVAVATRGNLASMVAPLPDLLFGLSMMHPALAAVGGALAAVGTGVAAFLTLSDNTSSAADATDRYAEAMETAQALTRTEVENAYALAEAKRHEAVERVKAALAIEQENMARLNQAKALLEADAKRLREEQRFLPQTANTNFMVEPMQRVAEQADQTAGRIAALQDQLDKLNNPRPGSIVWGDLHGEQAKTADDAFANLMKTVGGWVEEMERAEKAALSQARSLLESLDPAYKYANEVERLTALKPQLVELLGDEARAQEMLNKAIREADPAYKEAQRAAEEAARQRAREDERQAREMERQAQHTIERVTDFGADMLYGWFTETGKGWQGMWDGMRQYALRAIAQIAAQQIVTPVICPVGGRLTAKGA